MYKNEMKMKSFRLTVADVLCKAGLETMLLCRTRLHFSKVYLMFVHCFLIFENVC